MKPFKENNTGRVEPSETHGSQITCWDGDKLTSQPLPGDRPFFTGRTYQNGPRLQGSRGPQPNRTKGPAPAPPTVQGAQGPVTMVTATASVTVAVHPTLPGTAYQGYMHEGFDTDSESDCFEAAKRTYSDKTKLSSYKRDSLELQDLEVTENKTMHQQGKTNGEHLTCCILKICLLFCCLCQIMF